MDEPILKKPERHVKIRKMPPRDKAPSFFQKLNHNCRPSDNHLPNNPRNRVKHNTCSNLGSLTPNLLYFLEVALML